MGSGKGKSKRVGASRPVFGTQSAAALSPARILSNKSGAVQDVVLSRNAWARFVKHSGLKNVGLHEYYFGGKQSSGLVDAQYIKVVGDLFADAVSVGAIVLPSPYEPDDFMITVSDYMGQLDAVFCLKSSPAVKGSAVVIDRYVGSDYLLRSWELEIALDHLAVGVAGALSTVADTDSVL